MTAIGKNDDVSVGEVLGGPMRRPGVDEWVLTSINQERGGSHPLSQLPRSVRTRIEVGTEQAAKGLQECIVCVRTRISRSHFLNRFAETISRHPLGIGKTSIDCCLDTLLGRGRFNELRDKSLAQAWNGDDGEVDVPFGCVLQAR